MKFQLSSGGVCRGASGTTYLSAYIFAQLTDTLEYVSQPPQERRLPAGILAAYMMEYLCTPIPPPQSTALILGGASRSKQESLPICAHQSFMDFNKFGMCGSKLPPEAKSGEK